METPITFSNKEMLLRGILHSPNSSRSTGSIGVVFQSGWSGCRLGPHRMFVKTARELTANGCYCLRFDFAGRGDSDGNTQNASIQSMISDTVCAVDFLRSNTPAKQIFLVGICSGGKVSIATAASTPGIDGLILWSAEAMGRLRNSTVYARRSVAALLVYLKKLTHPTTWMKIFTLKVNTNMVGKAMFQHETASDDEILQEDDILDRFQSFKGPTLFVYGENDPNTKVAAENYAKFCTQAGIKHSFHEIANANHSFYSLKWEREVMDITKAWVSSYITKAGS
ncbi:MAG: alpha/beta hydrolase [Kiritimatiellae bacterium]|nr:alpha/beta hydrolase [Kiritimatiellia bacterium]